MKNLLLIAFTFILASGAFAGILENRRTGETIEFILNRADREIEVLSTSYNVENNTIRLSALVPRKSAMNLVAGVSWGVNPNVIDASGATVVFLLPVLAAYDAIALPLKAPLKLFHNMQLNRDFKKLMNAINSTDMIKVSNGRFRRIENLLNNN